MKRFMALVASLLCVTGLSLTLTGCSVNEETLANGQKRMDEFKALGVPDSALSSVKVYLFAARDAKQRELGSAARKAADSMNMAIKAVEAYYTNHVSKLQPTIDSLVQIGESARAQLSGLQVRKLDSLKMVVDSLGKAQRPVESEKVARRLAAIIPQLKADELKAAELRRIIPGSVWECLNRKSSEINKEVNSLEKKVFTFGRDGKAVYVESELGRSEKDAKTDYEFVSYGSYDFAGDTLVLFVDRFVSKRQIMEVRYVDPKTNKETWKKESGPAYDSLITDRSQDRFVTLADLKEDFKRK